MADRKDNKKNDSKAKAGKKANFFLDLKAELKRVNWPDKQKLIRSTAAVLVVSIAFALLIWVVDSLVYGGLNLVGFHGNKEGTSPLTTPNPITEQATPTPMPSATAGK